MLINDEKPDILVICETWLAPDFSSTFLGLKDYNIFRKDRPNGVGGGVMACVKKDYTCNEILVETGNEICIVDVRTKSGLLRLGIVYRPPSSNVDDSRNLTNVIRDNFDNSPNFLILGDSNYRGIDWGINAVSNSSEDYFVSKLNEIGVVQLIDKPTTLYESLLDLCISSDDRLVSNICIGELFSSSDHSIITCEVNMPNCKLSREEIFVNNFRKADWEMIRAELSLICWDQFFADCVNMDEKWIKFKTCIKNLMMVYVPSEIIRKNETPWFTNSLRRMKRTKQRKWNKYKRSPTNRHLNEYKSFSKNYSKELEKSKSLYEERKFNQKNTKAKQFFNFIRNATEVRDQVSTLEVNGRFIEKNSHKCEALSNHYKTVYTRDNNILPQCTQYKPPCSMTDIELSERDVVNAIHFMNADSSPGIDGIFPKFLKNVSAYLIKPLQMLYSQSLEEGTLPEEWTTSIIVPVYKKNRKPKECASYRPINITSCITKILEKCIHQKILHYLRTNDLISKAQHGFLNKRSTITNLLECTFDWTSYMNNRDALDVIYIDYEKAFDKVSHSKLFYKLKKFGIGGRLLRWMEIFIGRRRQTVKVGSSYSSMQNVDSGVAQGTLLGPLNFLLFISGVENVIDQDNCKIILYADDSKTYAKCNNVEEVFQLQENISSLARWCEEWQLSINSEKCEVLHIGRTNNNHRYVINGIEIGSSLNCRDLGVIIGNDLYYRAHFENISRNSHFLCKQYRKSFTSKNTEFLLFLYKTYVLPKIEYASNVWSPYYKKDVDLIENIQRKYTKFLPGMFHLSYTDRLTRLKLQTLEERRIYLDMILLYKIIHGLIEIDFNKYFSFNNANTRGHSFKLNMNSSRLNCHKYHFFNRVVKIWNSLPDDIVTASKLSVFKKNIFCFNVNNFCIGRAFT